MLRQKPSRARTLCIGSGRSIARRGRGEIGKRSGLKIRQPLGFAGSSPAARTIASLTRNAVCALGTKLPKSGHQIPCFEMHHSKFHAQVCSRRLCGSTNEENDDGPLDCFWRDCSRRSRCQLSVTGFNLWWVQPAV